jgi:Tol biopolymer transport system component
MRTRSGASPGRAWETTAVICWSLSTLLVALLGSCGETHVPLYDNEVSTTTYCWPSWSMQGVIAYGDRGGRVIEGEGVLVDSLVGIWTFDPGTGKHEHVTSFGKYPSWSPDGLSISFWHNYSLWICDIETGNVQLILPAGRYQHNGARWSPCGEYLIYASTEGVPYGYTIWRIEIATGTKVMLTPGQSGPRDPLWFSGCDSILYMKYEYGNAYFSSGMYVMSRGDQDARLILSSEYDERDPSMSQDGRYVSFCRAGTSRVYIYDRQKQEYNRGPRGPGVEPAWSPDSRKLVYVKRIAEPYAEINAVLMVYDLATGISRPLF